MSTIQTDIYTVIGTQPHIRAGDSVERPVSILFDDEFLGAVAELKLTARQAVALAAHLLEALKVAEVMA